MGKLSLQKKCILHRKICAAFWKANSTKSSYLKNFRKYATKKCFKATNLMIIITQLQFLLNLVHNITSYDWSNLQNLFFYFSHVHIRDLLRIYNSLLRFSIFWTCTQSVEMYVATSATRQSRTSGICVVIMWRIIMRLLKNESIDLLSLVESIFEMINFVPNIWWWLSRHPFPVSCCCHHPWWSLYSF